MGGTKAVIRKNITQSGIQAIPSSGSNLLKSIFMMQTAQNRLSNYAVIMRNFMSRSLSEN